MKFKNSLILIAILAFALALGGCGSSGEENQGVRSLPVEVQKVELGSVFIKDLVTGSLTPVADVPLIPKLGGKIEQIAVQVGQSVREGDLLIQLETTDIIAQLRQAEAALEAAKTGYTNAEAQIPANLKMAEVNYENAKTTYESLEQLFLEGGISKQQFEGAKAQLDVAKAQLDNARNAPLQLETVKAQVKQAQAAYDAVKAQLDNAAIRAPITGTVTMLENEVGHMVGPGMPIASVAQLDPMLGIFNLTESQVNKLAIGDEVEIYISAMGKTPFVGTVIEVAPVADPRTRGYKMKAKLPNENGSLRSGMTAQVGFVLDGIEDSIVVPLQSIVTKGNRQNIYLVEGEQARECPVEILLQDNTMAAISGEVKPGDQIVIQGQTLLQDGSSVKVVSQGGK
ncbi:MAG: efflux RND transporter periplasmic adaptor subunit [Bacillota bacterium]